jgi:hypothetical protein
MRTLCLIAWRFEVPHNLRPSVLGVLEPSAGGRRSDDFDAPGGATTAGGWPS